MMDSGEARIGISGWTYAPWRGGFYPKGLPHARELAYIASIYRSIEINGTFYRLQTPTTFANWAAQTPDGFVFTVKAPRFITHTRRLRNAAVPIANFFASGVLRLGPKLGPILWQLPPTLRFDHDLMAAFLALLPPTTHAAAKLAQRHDTHLRARAWLRTDAMRPLRHALEVRHESFLTPIFIALLRQHNVALVCTDSVAWPRLMDLTSDFIYCRLHGDKELYRSGYDSATLKQWAARIRAWLHGRVMRDGTFVTSPDRHPKPRDVFLFFDNTDKRRAPDDAMALIDRLGKAARGNRTASLALTPHANNRGRRHEHT